MAGTLSGGKLSARKNMQLYGSDFYRVIGTIGGSRGWTGGFYQNSELARIAGMKGGRKGKRGKVSRKWKADNRLSIEAAYERLQEIQEQAKAERERQRRLQSPSESDMV